MIMDMITAMRERDRFAKANGIEFVSAENGNAIARMTLGERHMNALDMAHGGAIFSLADYAFALASNSRGKPAVALSVSINFLRPGKTGVLTATAREQSLAGKVGTYLVEVTDETGVVLASFQGLAYVKG